MVPWLLLWSHHGCAFSLVCPAVFYRDEIPVAKHIGKRLFHLVLVNYHLNLFNINRFTYRPNSTRDHWTLALGDLAWILRYVHQMGEKWFIWSKLTRDWSCRPEQHLSHLPTTDSLSREGRERESGELHSGNSVAQIHTQGWLQILLIPLELKHSYSSFCFVFKLSNHSFFLSL